MSDDKQERGLVCLFCSVWPARRFQMYNEVWDLENILHYTCINFFAMTGRSPYFTIHQQLGRIMTPERIITRHSIERTIS